MSLPPTPTRPDFVTAQTSLQQHEKPACTSCGTYDTPYWRRNLDGKYICNACGLYEKSRGPASHTIEVKKQSPLRSQRGAQASCANCGTTTTSTWRRSETGERICNACGLYYKLHKVQRPKHMKVGVVQNRRRFNHGERAFTSSSFVNLSGPASETASRTSEPSTPRRQSLPSVSSLGQPPASVPSTLPAISAAPGVGPTKLPNLSFILNQSQAEEPRPSYLPASMNSLSGPPSILPSMPSHQQQMQQQLQQIQHLQMQQQQAQGSQHPEYVNQLKQDLQREVANLNRLLYRTNETLEMLERVSQ